MTSREKFEAWMTDKQWFHGSDFEWDERRNCYAQFGIHLAYKAFLAAEGAAEQKHTDMAVQLANAESKCRELAAESWAMKSSIPPLKMINDVTDSWDDVSIAEDVGFNLAISAIMKNLSETSTTDAFLAEVRAQGVEMYADTLDRGADDAECGGFDDGVKFLRAEAAGVREFAAQLRMERG